MLIFPFISSTIKTSKKQEININRISFFQIITICLIENFVFRFRSKNFLRIFKLQIKDSNLVLNFKFWKINKFENEFH